MLRAAAVDYPAGLYQPRHAHPVATVTLVLAGSLEERVGRRCERGTSLGVVLKPAGVEHDDRFGTAGARTIQIELGAAAAEGLQRRGELLAEWRWAPAGGAAGAFLTLLDALAAAAPADAIDERAWEVLAELPTAGPAGERAGSSGGPPAWLARVREESDDTPAEPHRVAALARAAGVHPVHLAREFRRCFGTTLSAHLQRRRIERAAELLAMSDEPVAAVAARVGYADQSHLGRQLRARTGLTPVRWRNAARRTLQMF